MKFKIFGLNVVILTLLTGCSGITPTATSASPSETSTPAATLASLIVSSTPVALPPTLTPSATQALPTVSPTPTTMQPLSGSGGGVIAFVSDRKGSQDIYSMNADGSDQRQLTTTSSNDGWPSWSPDGAQIVFHKIKPSGSTLNILDIASGEIFPLVVGGSGNKWEPAWSHDGKKIAFSNQPRNSFGNLYLIELPGNNKLRLTNTDSTDGGPVWSADDSMIAFYSDRDGNMEVYLMESDGSNQRRLTDNRAEDIVFSWSPDGSKIAFVSSRNGNYEIYTMNSDGSNQLRLTNHPGDDMYPAWSPDGTKIVYAAGDDTQMDIFIMNADGTNPLQLTDSPGLNFAPAWRPEPVLMTTPSAQDPSSADPLALTLGSL